MEPRIRTALLGGLSVLCYADDTLIVASGRSWENARILAEVGTRCVVSRIERLGLKVAV